MITGFNTDVRHRDVVFHVQTEDKGTGNPCIESLVYVGGQILARKRAGYRSLLDGDAASKAVAELMEQQHRSLIDEIRSGKMDEKVAALKGPPKTAAPGATEVQPPAGAAPQAAPAAPRPAAAAPAAEPAAPPKPAEPPTAVPPRVAAAEPAASPPAPSPPVEEPPADASTVAPMKMPPIPARPPAPKPPPIRRPPAPSGPPEGGARSLDQVILDYLEMESGQDKLVLSMDRKSGELAPGGEAELDFRTESSIDADPIGETLISVSLISTFEEPRVLGEGRTDDAGKLTLKISIPRIKAGSGALIIKADSSIGGAEIRHLI